MLGTKMFLLKRLAKQSLAAMACCGELAKISREIVKISSQLSVLPVENFTAGEWSFIEETGRRIAAMSAAINSAAEGSK